MKKILVITLEFPPQVGGIATYIDQICKNLDPTKIVVLAPKMERSDDFDKKQPYKIIRASLLFPRFLWPRWIKLCYLVWKISGNEKIDLIMVHHVLPSGYVALIMKKMKKIPFLVFGHGVDYREGTKNAWKANMVRIVCLHAEQIVLNSEYFKSLWDRYWPDLMPRTMVLYPCPDPDFFIQPKASELDILRKKFALEGKKVIFSASRISEGKGFPHLARILPQIITQIPNLVWLIAGDGPKKPELLAQIQENNLQNVVRFLGEIPHSDLKKFYYVADIFVLLTHQDNGRDEGIGQVFLEAAAAGKPIIAGKCGGVEEAVQNGKTGYVFDIRREQKPVIAAISGLLHDKMYCESIGSSGRERMEAEFNWSHQLAKINKWTE